MVRCGTVGTVKVTVKWTFLVSGWWWLESECMHLYLYVAPPLHRRRTQGLSCMWSIAIGAVPVDNGMAVMTPEGGSVHVRPPPLRAGTKALRGGRRHTPRKLRRANGVVDVRGATTDVGRRAHHVGRSLGASPICWSPAAVVGAGGLVRHVRPWPLTFGKVRTGCCW